MKNTTLKLLKNLYYIAFVVLLILYLFPGSLIGYLFYGDHGKQPKIIDSPIGTSINHLIYFTWLTILALIIRSQTKNLLANIHLIFLLSFILEILHFLIPNRAFEYYDVFANMLGVILGFIIYKLFKWINFF